MTRQRVAELAAQRRIRVTPQLLADRNPFLVNASFSLVKTCEKAGR